MVFHHFTYSGFSSFIGLFLLMSSSIQYYMTSVSISRQIELQTKLYIGSNRKMNLLVLNGFPAIDRKNVVARCPEMTENAKFSPERQKLWRSLSGSIRSCGFLPGFFRIVKRKYALLARRCFLSHRVRFPPHLPSIPTLVGANKLAGCGGLFCMPAKCP